MSNTITNEKLFKETAVPKAILSLAVPTVVGQLIHFIYNIADTFFVGQLNDPNQVAAATVCMPVFLITMLFSNLFGIGGSCVISRCFGKGNNNRAKKAAAFSVWASIAVALVYGIFIHFTKSFLISGTNEASFQYCSDYIFWTITIGSVPTVLSGVLSHIIRSEGFAKQSAFGIALGGILNIILDPIFIFTLGLEIKGAAIATMISNICSAIYFLLIFYVKRKSLTVSISPKYFSPKDSIAKDVFLGGLPSSVMSLMASISSSTLNGLMVQYSNEAIAGFGIAKKIDLIVFGFAQGIAQGALPLIAYNFAAKNNKRLKQAIITTTLYSFCSAVFVTVVLYFFAAPISNAFIDNTVTVDFAQRFLKILAIGCPVIALNFLFITIFQAVGAKVQPLVLSVLRKGALDIPLMFLFDRLIGVNGIPLCTPISEAIACFIAIGLFVPFLKKQGVFIKDKN